MRTATPPNLLGQPDIKMFRRDDFQAAIWNKGYPVVIEQAIACPCKGTSGSPKSSCQNCLGLGVVFINPVKTKALISSINKNTKYQQWSPEYVGTVNITVMDSDRISYMDRVTFFTRSSILSEIKKVLVTGEQRFIFCSYKVSRILNMFLFDTDTSKLVKVPENEYTVSSSNGLVVNLNLSTYPANFNDAVSIEYEHKVSYNIIDLSHDFRSTFITNEKGQNIEYNMPNQGIGRRSHLELGTPTNYGGTNLINNDTV